MQQQTCRNHPVREWGLLLTDTQAARGSCTLPAYWLGAASFWSPKLNLWLGRDIVANFKPDFNVANHPVLTDLVG
jgi:hypothetical protein